MEVDDAVAELRQWRYFVEAARAGTITAAARQLHVTQSVISEQILNLEQEYGCPLLVRSPRGVRATPEGELLLSQAAGVLRDFDRTEEQIKASGRERRTRVRVGAGGGLLRWLTPLLTRYSQMHPDVQFGIAEHTRHDVFRFVGAGDLDLGVTTVASDDAPNPLAGHLGAVDPPPGLTLREVFREDLVLVVPAAHTLAGSARVGLAHLRGERFAVFPQGSVLRGLVVEACRRAGFDPMVGIETYRTALMGEFAAAGLGVGLVPRSAATHMMPPGVAIVEVVPDERPKRAVVTVEPAGRRLPGRVVALRDFIAAAAARHFDDAVPDAADAVRDTGHAVRDAQAD